MNSKLDVSFDVSNSAFKYIRVFCTQMLKIVYYALTSNVQS